MPTILEKRIVGAFLFYLYNKAYDIYATRTKEWLNFVTTTKFYLLKSFFIY